MKLNFGKLDLENLGNTAMLPLDDIETKLELCFPKDTFWFVKLGKWRGNSSIASASEYNG